MTNAVNLSVREVIELYSLRWQIELFFKELKSTLGLAQYSFKDFRAVETWVELAITTVLYLEDLRITRMNDRRLSQRDGDGGRCKGYTGSVWHSARRARATS